MVLVYLVMFLFTPLVALIGILGVLFNTKSWRKYLFLLLISVFLVSYSYNPVNFPDLYRYLQYINECRGLSLIQVNQLFNDSLYVKNFFFWLAALINNPHLIPAITTTIVYGVTWYITCDNAEMNKSVKSIPLVLMVQTMCLQFVSIVNNVRNVSALSLAILAVYLEIVKKKRNLLTILLYVIPVFIHPAALIIILFRLIMMLPKGYIFLSLIISLFFPTLINFLHSFGSIFGSVISKYINNLWWYLNDPLTSEWSRTVSNSTLYSLQKFTMIGLAGVLILLFLLISRRNGFSSEEQRKFATLDVLLCIATLACIPITAPMYWRFSTANVCASGIMLNKLFERKDNKVIVFKLVLFFLAILLLLLQFLIGRYSINYSDFLKNVMINNIYVVILKFIAGILGVNIG